MQTYKVKMGDVVKFPNGVEVNYSEADQTLVVLYPSPSKTLTVRTDEDGIVLIGLQS
jgi:hypothetical protein